MSDINQSANRVFHSTETALLKIQKDITTSMDQGTAAGLVLLDLSTAYDTIDHSILFNYLQYWYVIGVVLEWVQSYLNPRKQQIKIDGHLLDAFQLPYGDSQSSVLGALLFNLYTLASVISKFNVIHYLHADDVQMYMELDSRNFDSSTTERIIDKLALYQIGPCQIGPKIKYLSQIGPQEKNTLVKSAP